MKIQNSIIFLLLAIGMVACEAPTGDSEADAADSTEMEPVETTLTVSPFPGSKEYPNAGIESFTYAGNMFNFILNDSDYKLGVQTPDAPQRMCANSGKGQHIHLIIDNAPYSAQYTAEFEYPIENGEHYMLAFLSRSYHESIKTDAAHVARKITVNDGTISAQSPIEGPMLFYSRPKGTYVGKADTDKLLLDFFPINVELGNDYKVKVEIDGSEEAMLNSWQPYSIEGLSMGEHTITLTLVDGTGQTVDAPLNPVSRTITLQADPIEQ